MGPRGIPPGNGIGGIMGGMPGRGGIPGIPGIPGGMPMGGMPIGGAPGIIAPGAGPPNPRTGPARPTGAMPAAGVGNPATHKPPRSGRCHTQQQAHRPNTASYNDAARAMS